MTTHTFKGSGAYCETCRHHPYEPPHAGRDWRAMPPADFDTEAQPQPLALFPEPDRTGTPDLFTTDDTTEEHAS